MRNGSAAVWQPTSARTITERNPAGDFTATYMNTIHGLTTGRMTVDDIPHLTEGRLSQMADKTFVIIYGTIDFVRVFEPAKDYMPPSAMVRVESSTGAATYIRVDSRAYDRIWGFLVSGRSYGFSGNVVRPEPDAPEFIKLNRILMTGADVHTPATYDAAQHIARQAVTV